MRRVGAAPATLPPPSLTSSWRGPPYAPDRRDALDQHNCKGWGCAAALYLQALPGSRSGSAGLCRALACRLGVAARETTMPPRQTTQRRLPLGLVSASPGCRRYRLPLPPTPPKLPPRTSACAVHSVVLPKASPAFACAA